SYFECFSLTTILYVCLSLSTITLFSFLSFFFFNDTATTEIYTLSLHDALPIYGHKAASDVRDEFVSVTEKLMDELAQCNNVPIQIGRAVQQECRDRSRMPSSA